MKRFFSTALAMLLLLAGCSSDTKATPDNSSEPTIATSDAIMTTATPSESLANVSGQAVSSEVQKFDLTTFIEQVIFDTKKDPKMTISSGSESFYADIKDALKIKDALNTQSWEPVSKDSIPYGTIESSISLHNGNHPGSEILIDTERHYVYVTVYNTDGPQGVDNARQYPYGLGETVVKDVQTLVNELKAAAK